MSLSGSSSHIYEQCFGDPVSTEARNMTEVKPASAAGGLEQTSLGDEDASFLDTAENDRIVTQFLADSDTSVTDVDGFPAINKILEAIESDADFSLEADGEDESQSTETGCPVEPHQDPLASSSTATLIEPREMDNLQQSESPIHCDKLVHLNAEELTAVVSSDILETREMMVAENNNQHVELSECLSSFHTVDITTASVSETSSLQQLQQELTDVIVSDTSSQAEENMVEPVELLTSTGEHWTTVDVPIPDVASLCEIAPEGGQELQQHCEEVSSPLDSELCGFEQHTFQTDAANRENINDEDAPSEYEAEVISSDSDESETDVILLSSSEVTSQPAAVALVSSAGSVSTHHSTDTSVCQEISDLCNESPVHVRYEHVSQTDNMSQPQITTSLLSTASPMTDMNISCVTSSGINAVELLDGVQRSSSLVCSVLEAEGEGTQLLPEDGYSVEPLNESEAGSKEISSEDDRIVPHSLELGEDDVELSTSTVPGTAESGCTSDSEVELVVKPPVNTGEPLNTVTIVPHAAIPPESAAERGQSLGLEDECVLASEVCAPEEDILKTVTGKRELRSDDAVAPFSYDFEAVSNAASPSESAAEAGQGLGLYTEEVPAHVSEEGNSKTDASNREHVDYDADVLCDYRVEAISDAASPQDPAAVRALELGLDSEVPDSELFVSEEDLSKTVTDSREQMSDYVVAPFSYELEAVSNAATPSEPAVETGQELGLEVEEIPANASELCASEKGNSKTDTANREHFNDDADVLPDYEVEAVSDASSPQDPATVRALEFGLDSEEVPDSGLFVSEEDPLKTITDTREQTNGDAVAPFNYELETNLNVATPSEPSPETGQEQRLENDNTNASVLCVCEENTSETDAANRERVNDDAGSASDYEVEVLSDAASPLEPAPQTGQGLGLDNELIHTLASEVATLKTDADEKEKVNDDVAASEAVSCAVSPTEPAAETGQKLLFECEDAPTLDSELCTTASNSNISTVILVSSCSSTVTSHGHATKTVELGSCKETDSTSSVIILKSTSVSTQPSDSSIPSSSSVASSHMLQCTSAPASAVTGSIDTDGQFPPNVMSYANESKSTSSTIFRPAAALAMNVGRNLVTEYVFREIVAHQDKWNDATNAEKEKVKRIKRAYEHLVEADEVYGYRAAKKCRCGYSAASLRDLERHRQFGYSKLDGSAAFSCNRAIWCCYCFDNVPYNISKFASHMLKVHNIVSRHCLPIVKQCPYCNYGYRYNNVKSQQHIETCRSLFKPNVNLYYPGGIFDLPLLPKDKQRKNVPVNVKHLGSRVHEENRSVASNPPARTSTSWTMGTSSGIVPVVSPSLLPVSLISAVSRFGHVVSCPTTLASRMPSTTSVVSAAVPVPVPVRLPVMSLGNLLGYRFPPVSSTFWSTMSFPYVMPVQQPNALSSNSAVNLALNCLRFAPLSAAVAVPLQRPNNTLNSFQSAFGSTISVPNMPRHAPVNIPVHGVKLPPYRLQGVASKESLSGVNTSSGPVPLSSNGTISSVYSKKMSGIVSSARKPVVVLRRLSISACEVCGSMFKKPQLLRRHLLKAHSISVITKDLVKGSPPKPLQCVCCPMKFFSKQGLSRHLKIVHELASKEFCCSRCPEKGISDLIEHFHVKHDIPLRMMVEWRVCYLCKLNFPTVSGVENHVISTHADIFPSRLKFRKAVHESLSQKHSSVIQTPRGLLVSDQGTNTGSLDHPHPVSGVNRKRPYSVIDITEDSSDLNSNDSSIVQTIGNKHKRHANNVVVPSGSSGSTLQSSESEPVIKKARRTSNVSVEAQNCNTPEVKTRQLKSLSPENNTHKQHSAHVLEKGEVLGTVSHITKSQPVVLLPGTKEKRKSLSSSSVSKPSPDVSVRLLPLNSMHAADSSIAPQMKECPKGDNSLKKLTTKQDMSVRRMSLSSKHAADLSKVPPVKESSKGDSDSLEKTSAGQDVSVRLTPLDSMPAAGLSVAPQAKDSTKNDNSLENSAAVPDVSVRLTPLNSMPVADSSGAPQTKDSTKSDNSCLEKSATVLDVSVHLTPLNSIPVADSSVAAQAKDSTKSAKNSLKKPAVKPHVPARRMSFSSKHAADSSVVPLAEESQKSSGSTDSKPTGVSDVSIDTKPSNSVNSEESSAQKEKHKYSCSLCSKNLDCWISFSHHFKSLHGIDMQQCTLCLEPVPRGVLMVQHMTQKHLVRCSVVLHPVKDEKSKVKKRKFSADKKPSATCSTPMPHK